MFLIRSLIISREVFFVLFSQIEKSPEITGDFSGFRTFLRSSAAFFTASDFTCHLHISCCYIFYALSQKLPEPFLIIDGPDGQINIIDALKQLKYVDEFEMISMLAQQYGLEVLDLSTYRIPPEVIETVPREIVQQYKIVPVMKHDDVLTIAMSDPTDMATLDSIRFLMK